MGVQEPDKNKTREEIETMSLDYIRFTLPELYPYVMLTAGLISFQCLLIGFGAGAKRKTVFDADKLKEKLK